MNNNNNNSSSRGSGPTTYYDILEVPVDADASTIRKAYLKKSLKYHPDKNPNNVQAAKAKFIRIGEANEVLSDPAKRRAYDHELRATGGRPRPNSSGFGFHFNNNKTNTNNNNNNNNSNGGGGWEEDHDQAYETYMDAFDSTVAGMSEAELGVMIGTISALAGIVGSLVGSRVLGGGADASQGRGRVSASASATTSAKSRFLGSAGSVVGGMVASKAASSSVRALHQDSIQRLSYKEDCRRALERGDPVPDPPRTSFLGSQLGGVLKNTFGASNSHASNNDSNWNNIPNNHTNGNGNASRNGQHQHQQQREGGSGQGPDLWGMAAAALAAGAKAAAAKQR